MIERLRERLEEAEKHLFVLAEEAEPILEKMRLKGKEQGVRLALSYLDEEERLTKQAEMSRFGLPPQQSTIGDNVATATPTDTKTVRQVLEMLKSIPEERMDSPFIIEMPSGQYDLTDDCDIDWSDDNRFAILDMTEAKHHTNDHRH